MIRNLIGTMFEGKLFQVKKFEHEGHTYEAVDHPGAVAIVAYDSEFVYLVTQERPVVSTSQEMIEIPAGTMEEEEDPRDTAMRELAEECGLGANTWTFGTSFYSSPGYCNEKVLIFFATNLYEVSADQDEGENVTVVKWKLEDLDNAIRTVKSAKSKIGLMMLKEGRRMNKGPSGSVWRW